MLSSELSPELFSKTEEKYLENLEMAYWFPPSFIFVAKNWDAKGRRDHPSIQYP